VETVFANLEKVHQIVVLIVMKDITKRDVMTTMFIGTTATAKEMIKHKNAEIQVGRMNTDAQEIGFKENG
jgi:hypothetical protein